MVESVEIKLDFFAMNSVQVRCVFGLGGSSIDSLFCFVVCLAAFCSSAAKTRSRKHQGWMRRSDIHVN